MADCDRDDFLPTDVDVVDACGGVAYATGPEIVAGGDSDGCPVGRRPEGDRYLFVLLDAPTRAIQVGMIHPEMPPWLEDVATWRGSRGVAWAVSPEDPRSLLQQ